MNWADWRGALFDLDGVITPTAMVHEHAWLELFAPWDATPADYLAHIDGKPRYDGVADFLRSRGVELPYGDADDPPGDETVCALGNRKNEYFHTILERDGVTPYPGTMAVLDLLDTIGVNYGVVSSSKNADAVLRAAGIRDRFAVLVDGTTAHERSLPGKPDPAMFLLGAELIGIAPADIVVIEDATSGVEAGAAGGFGMVLGVDRGGNAGALRLAGANEVVNDLSETLPAQRSTP